MRHAVLIVMLAVPHGVAMAAVPTDVQSEIREMTRRAAPLQHLIPRGTSTPGEGGSPDCLASFAAKHSFSLAEHWCLVEAKQGHMLRYWNEESGVGEKPNSREVLEQPIPSAVAEDIRQLWLLAVVNARYPPVWSGGLDGTTYIFVGRRYSVQQLLAADVHSPRGDTPPLWMAELGSKIFQYASSGNLGAANLAESVADVKKRVLSFYEGVR